MSQKVSVLIIAQNVEQTVVRCLDSLKIFDEVVFVDGGSTDRTLEIAASYDNVKIYKNPWPGFVEQRNYSLEKASHEWCFMIDADEALNKDTAEEIYRVVNSNPSKVLYRIMRTEYYLGEQIESGYGKSEYQERLFIKNRVRYSGGVHHTHLIDGKETFETSELIENFPSKYRILHDNRYGLNEWIRKLPRFAVTVAEEKIQRGKKTNAFIVFLSFVGTFFQIWFKCLKLGKVGIVIAFQTAIYRSLVKLIMYERSEIGFDEKQNKGESLG
ncbi:MAG: glycosyltransferase family 2 protein [Bacteriovoracaceae bacterium]